MNSQESVKAILADPILNQYLNDKENFTQSVLYIAEDKDIVLCEDFKILVGRFDQKV